MRNDSVPWNYNAPRKVEIGTNTLENVNFIVKFKGFIPVLIGDGERPHVWLNIPTNKEGTEWIPLVKDNFSTNPAVIVVEKDNSVKIATPEGIVLDCAKMEDGTLKVNQLNLNPFGLKLESNAEMLTFMNSTFQRNGFKNLDTMFVVANE
jgi:hypothetical protein